MFLARSTSVCAALRPSAQLFRNHKAVATTKQQLAITTFSRFFTNGQNLLASNVRVKDTSGKEIGEDFFKGKKVVLFGVPGAFTPVCSYQHLTSYIQNAEKLKEAGIDEVVCVAVNDPFVMKAWGEHLKVGDKVTLLSDWNASFVKNLGLDTDLSAAGLGTRAKRFSLIIDNGKVTHQFVEPKPGEVSVTGADTILQILKPNDSTTRKEN
eukprot:TRINITY_DN16673_c0_g1_i1.p1 TRINITY_DN16673_c0_g1~~TRINITY_DN16673_c0_g1_i1.p1  ORF type:complete len:210 (-),score=43.51 TRINITY_DN16673_c0_g1_i1:22-651(-)